MTYDNIDWKKTAFLWDGPETPVTKENVANIKLLVEHAIKNMDPRLKKALTKTIENFTDPIEDDEDLVDYTIMILEQNTLAEYSKQQSGEDYP